MDPRIEALIRHYYPARVLVSPIGDRKISWDYDRDYKVLKAAVADLEALDRVRPGTRGRYDIAEEFVVGDQVRVLFSYLGPFVAVNARARAEPNEAERALIGKVRAALQRHGLAVLGEEALDERAPWIERRAATVYQCLFVLPSTIPT
jgi:hypothetical protein